jgi:hypothetical protein
MQQTSALSLRLHKRRPIGGLSLSDFPCRCIGSNAHLMYPYDAWMDVEISLVCYTRVCNVRQTARISRTPEAPAPARAPIESLLARDRPVMADSRQVGELVLSTLCGPSNLAAACRRTA